LSFKRKKLGGAAFASLPNFCIHLMKNYLIAKTDTGLPRSLSAAFQEYDIEQLNPAQHRNLIIERVLAYGNQVEVKWLFETYNAAQIKKWLARSGARRLPWRRFNLWCVLLELPPAQRLRSDEQRIWHY
jgi:hypothetical protein